MLLANRAIALHHLSREGVLETTGEALAMLPGEPTFAATHASGSVRPASPRIPPMINSTFATVSPWRMRYSCVVTVRFPVRRERAGAFQCDGRNLRGWSVVPA